MTRRVSHWRARRLYETAVPPGACDREARLRWPKADEPLFPIVDARKTLRWINEEAGTKVQGHGLRATFAPSGWTRRREFRSHARDEGTAGQSPSGVGRASGAGCSGGNGCVTGGGSGIVAARFPGATDLPFETSAAPSEPLAATARW